MTRKPSLAQTPNCFTSGKGGKNKTNKQKQKNPTTKYTFVKKILIFLLRIKLITGTPKSNKNNCLANHPFLSESSPCFYLTEPYTTHSLRHRICYNLLLLPPPRLAPVAEQRLCLSASLAWRAGFHADLGSNCSTAKPRASISLHDVPRKQVRAAGLWPPMLEGE